MRFYIIASILAAGFVAAAPVSDPATAEGAIQEKRVCSVSPCPIITP